MADSPLPDSETILLCRNCDWRYAGIQLQDGQPAPGPDLRCPHCFQKALRPLEPESAAQLEDPQPELAIPFSLSPPVLSQRLNSFASGIRFAPRDLEAKNLVRRLKKIYLPVWLVDVEVEAEWQAETGYDYEVVSHQSRYADLQGWQSREVQETRIRWEPRQGNLKRDYHNIAAPALEEDQEIRRALGDFDLAKAQEVQDAPGKDIYLRMPNRDMTDAWPAAQPRLQNAASEECRQAAGADHIRGFRWSPNFSGQNWTLLLLPVFTTYYLDDDRLPHPILIHGQSGRLQGSRRASMKRAQQTSIVILVIAAALFLFSILVGAAGLIFPPVLILAAIGLLAAILLGIGASIPPLMVWQFNRSQE